MEEFKQIEKFPNYEVSNLGNVRNAVSKKFMAFSINEFGYCIITLRDGVGTKTIKVHRLVAMAFIENPERKFCINHKDGNKQNNRADNLEWSTYSENMKHAYANGLNRTVGKKGGSSHFAKLTPEQVAQIRSLKGKKTQKEIGQMFGVGQSQVSKIHSGATW